MTQTPRFLSILLAAASCAACSGDDATNPLAEFPSGPSGTTSGTAPQAGEGGVSAPGTGQPVSGDAGALSPTTGSTAGAGAWDAAVISPDAGNGGGSLPTADAGGPDTATTNPQVTPPVCMSKAPAEFEINERIGGGGQHTDSAHFALFGARDPETVLNFMESAHQCFIEDWCFRTPGLSTKSGDDGPYYKTNIYSNAFMGAGGLTYWDQGAELAYINILASQIADPRTTVHEYGHAITMSEHNWIDQKNTGFWWETVANWVSYSFLTSPYCEGAREAFGIEEATTIIDQMHTLDTIYGQSYSVLCNDQNYYQAWPFLYFLTTNLDNYPGLGKLAVQDLMREYKLNSNETPLHTLERIATPITVQTIVGRYWARMAYMDIGLPIGQKDFLSKRATLNYAGNLDSAGGSTYRVKASRKPQYFGANITPLNGTGDVSIAVTNNGNGRAESDFTATLAIFASDTKLTRYVDLPMGVGQANLQPNEEASLVVVNTPTMLYDFDPQYIRSPENIGLDYEVQIDGATPAN